MASSTAKAKKTSAKKGSDVSPSLVRMFRPDRGTVEVDEATAKKYERHEWKRI